MKKMSISGIEYFTKTCVDIESAQHRNSKDPFFA